MIRRKKHKSNRTIHHRPLPTVVMTNTYREQDGDHTRLVFESSDDEIDEESDDDKKPSHETKIDESTKKNLHSDEHIYEVTQ